MEIANSGDFVTRKVGGRPIILVRDSSGTAHAFVNSCPHRGNIVCRERAGSTRLLRCFYHAWAFDLEGHLAAVPGDDAYTPAFNRDALGLKPVPRFESYRGMLFLSFDPAIDGLVSYLGNAREYLDLVLEFGGEDVEIVHGSQACSMKANWKLLGTAWTAIMPCRPTSGSLTSISPISAWTRRAGPVPTVFKGSVSPSAAAMP
jgi:p-cumate 2,3-dioxygenase alpha subunit